MFYRTYGRFFPFFLRATQRKHFKKLAVITEIETGDELRTRVKPSFERIKATQPWIHFAIHSNVDALDALNLEKLDTIQ
jgi:hypothetical protein